MLVIIMLGDEDGSLFLQFNAHMQIMPCFHCNVCMHFICMY